MTFACAGEPALPREVHAQVAMLVLVATITQPVRGVHGAADDERAGGDEGHQAIATESPARQMRDPYPWQASGRAAGNGNFRREFG